MTAVAMRKSKPPRHSQNIRKRARAGVKGLIISWADTDPLSSSDNIINPQIRHRNPVYRLTARTIFQEFGDWITNRAPFRWLITIRVVFDYPNGRTQYEYRELEAVTTVNALNDHCLVEIEDAMRHGNPQYYRHTEFTIECLGDR